MLWCSSSVGWENQISCEKDYETHPRCYSTAELPMAGIVLTAGVCCLPERCGATYTHDTSVKPAVLCLWFGEATAEVNARAESSQGLATGSA